MKVTVQSFRDYLSCKRKLFLREQGETGEETNYARFIAEARESFGAKVISHLCETYKTDITHNDEARAQQLRLGASLLLGVTIKHENFSVRVDALKRVAGESALGDFHYNPILFYSGETIRNSERLLLAFQGLMVGALQGYLPSTGLIIIGDSFRCSTVNIQSYYASARAILSDVVDISSGKVEPPLILNEHCHECLYMTLCRDKATSEDNLSLLDRIREQDIKKYNSKGIFSLHQLSYTFRPRRRSKRAKKVAQPHNHALQALALRENRIYVLEKPGISTASNCVHVDMEGDQRGQFVYLIGILVVENGTFIHHALWADERADEANIFGAFLDILKSASPTHLFHYGSYEGRVFKRIAGTSKLAHRADALDLLKAHCTNALTSIFGKVYFPTYSNQLKEIGRYLGCSWSEENASGRYSMMWRKQWEDGTNVSDRKTLKDRIMHYNREDCVALKTVVECLTRIDAHDVTKADPEDRTAPAFVESISERERPAKFGRKDFASKDFEIITRCAYFEYQQTKVFIRTDSNKRSRTQRLRAQKRRPTYRINRIVEFRTRKCPYCGSTDLHRDRGQYYSKLTLDLRVTSSAIKRWVTKCQHMRHTCKACNRHVVPKRYKLQPRLGHSLMAWSIHQHVVNRTTFEQMEATLRDHFALQVRFSKLHELKSIAATYYARTYRNIIKRLLAGELIHADETKVRLQKEDGYVWVFASTENVVFLYRPSRKTDFLREFLSGFDGVLVTDFYNGYDSLSCLQQKCLVHLMRDINDALLKHPFDAEAKDFGQRFGELLRRIVGTIDRFGLRKRYLARHKKDTEKWLRDVEGITYRTETVEKLRKRVVKYGPRLFEFLNHDGVPWNNNNAEHAVKHFAKYRRLVNGRVTEQGVRDYLVLLSIYETCRYRGISFWHFLLSGLRDIDHFAERNRRSNTSRNSASISKERS